MTTLQISGHFTFAPAPGPKRCIPSKLSVWKTACAIVLLCAATAIATSAQTFTRLLSFDLARSYPQGAPLVQGIDGNFYGTTSGVNLSNAQIVPGTIFKMTPNGVLTTLYTFCAQTNCADGATPAAGLILASDGNFYGTTYWGGATNSGTVFKITPNGALTTLHSFNGADGHGLQASLVQATDGNFYGVTAYGGPGDCSAGGCGTVFRMTPSGTLTTLHSFDGADGAVPLGLTQATDGNFYGTTQGYWNYPQVYNGTIFKMTLDGAFTIIDSWGSTSLVQGSDGDLYGTGGLVPSSYNWSFEKITTSGAVTVLWGWYQGGRGPSTPLIRASDGSFYGTVPPYFHNNQYQWYGKLFRLTPAGHFRWLYAFDDTDGYPASALVQGTDGNFYGTTDGGGLNGYGTAFRLSNRLTPFVAFIRDSGIVGATVQILGQGFTGTTGVSFNGTAALFTIESDTYLTATVPAGASWGFVTVTTAAGILKSNVAFRVTPQIFSYSPTSSPVGSSVAITGESLKRAYAVTFGNVPAIFTVDSDTQVTATVPAGAQTGKIYVLTPGGTARSAECFIVTP